jgi:hypothetical protein
MGWAELSGLAGLRQTIDEALESVSKRLKRYQVLIHLSRESGNPGPKGLKRSPWAPAFARETITH